MAMMSQLSAKQLDAKPAEIRLECGLNPQRSTELIDEMRAAGLPVCEPASGVHDLASVSANLR